MNNDNERNVLFFKTETAGHPLGYSYVTIARGPVTIKAGDALEYDIFIDLTSPLSQAGVELHFVSGRCMRDSMIIDQNGMWSHPLTNLYDAVDTWYHRKMDLSSLAGETVASVEVAFVSPIAGTYLACFRNIELTRNGKRIHEFYASGVPEVVESKIQLGFFNDVVQAIRWDDFRKVKLQYIDPMKLSPELQLAEKLLTVESGQQEHWSKLIDQAKQQLEVKKYVDHDDAGFQQSLARVAATLAPILREARTFTTHFIGHAHIDMNWLWVWDETLAVCHRDFETMTMLMEKYSFFTFSQSQVSIYKAVMKTRPDLFERIRYFVNRGQWEITAAMWVEGDENMAAGEAIVRQFLLANRFIKKHFGKEPTVCWQPDLFGHVWTMPQILSKCGVKYYYFMRCGKTNPHVFWWEAPDGSRVLAATTNNYNGSIGQDTINYGFELYRKQGVKDYMHVYGVGDHGGGPTMRDIERGVELSHRQYLPKVQFGTVAGYFDKVAAENPNLPVVRDELQFIFEGCYTTHADIKLRNRQCENLFPVLEMFSVLALPFELPYPKFILDEGWERTCFNQFHDILPGSAIHATYEEAISITDGWLAAGERALEKSLQTLAAQINTASLGDDPIVVFNPSNWTRSDVVTVELPLLTGEWAEITDPTGKPIACQIVRRYADRATAIFIAESVPAIGYKAYSWRKVNSEPNYQTTLGITDDLCIENQFYRLKIDRRSGGICSWILKATNREMIAPDQQANIFQLLHEAGHEMSAWQIGKILETTTLQSPHRIEVLENGPVRVLLQIVHEQGASTFIQRLAIYDRLQRIDFPCSVNWQEIGSRETGSQFLKVAFPLNLSKSAKATFEIPFGHIDRDGNGHEYPTQKWLQVSDGEMAICLANDCKYGCDVSGNVVRLSLLRASYEPDPMPDRGWHHFKYALNAHEQAAGIAGSLRDGYELNQPLRAVVAVSNAGPWPVEQSLVRISAPNVMSTAFKKAEDDDSLIIRCYEFEGRETVCRFDFAFHILMANETDLLERDLPRSRFEIDNDGFEVQVAPFEIKTLRVVREKTPWPKRHSFVPVDTLKQQLY
ncbi:MAG: glycosyl hydrolase-related protein [candidate division KSB1 bacterium]|nr:glycosyl hydrolase-related protein [candidate division KSB1 bacterium]